jgi:hypothetical protein
VHGRVLADNVARAVDEAGEGGRVFVWTDLTRASGDFGSKLRERLAGECVRIGLTFDQGSGVTRRGELAPADVASLRSLKRESWIDLRRAAPETVLPDLRAKLDGLVWYGSVSAAER